MRSPKRKYYILLGGIQVGTSWAVSAKKAVANYWWRVCKDGNKYKFTGHSVEDFDAVEAM